MLTIHYEITGHGWARCDIRDEKGLLRITASYLSDALGSLSGAVLAITSGKESARATFDEEPGEFRWIFTRKDGIVKIEILKFKELWSDAPDSEGTLIYSHDISVEGLRNSMIACLDEILKKMTVQEYKKKWEFEFPIDAHNKLKNYE